MNGSNNLMRVVLIMNVVLVAAVCLLVAKDFLKETPSAYASGGAAGGKLIAVPITLQGGNGEVLAVIDTSSDSLILYRTNQQGEIVYPSAGRTMDQDFSYLTKLDLTKKKDTYFNNSPPNWTPAQVNQTINALNGTTGAGGTGK